MVVEAVVVRAVGEVRKGLFGAAPVLSVRSPTTDVVGNRRRIGRSRSPAHRRKGTEREVRGLGFFIRF